MIDDIDDPFDEIDMIDDTEFNNIINSVAFQDVTVNDTQREL